MVALVSRRASRACKSSIATQNANTNIGQCIKKAFKQHATELCDAALFKDPPPKGDCPICFLPMPARLLSCVSLPNTTRSSVPIYDFAIANEGLAKERMEKYYTSMLREDYLQRVFTLLF
jgi:hypothetical protein